MPYQPYWLYIVWRITLNPSAQISTYKFSVVTSTHFFKEFAEGI